MSATPAVSLTSGGLVLVPCDHWSPCWRPAAGLAASPPLPASPVPDATLSPHFDHAAGCKQRRRRIKELRTSLSGQQASTGGQSVPSSVMVSAHHHHHHASPFQMLPMDHAAAPHHLAALPAGYQCHPLAPQYSFPPPSGALLHHQLSGTPLSLLGSSDSVGSQSLDGSTGSQDCSSLTQSPPHGAAHMPQMTTVMLLPHGAQLPPGAQLVMMPMQHGAEQRPQQYAVQQPQQYAVQQPQQYAVQQPQQHAVQQPQQYAVQQPQQYAAYSYAPAAMQELSPAGSALQLSASQQDLQAPSSPLSEQLSVHCTPSTMEPTAYLSTPTSTATTVPSQAMQARLMAEMLDELDFDF